jgi:hypothetical protein
MSAFNRLIAPASFLPVLLPIIAINLVIQTLHLAGLVGYDGEKVSYIISGGYIVSIVLEAASVWRQRKVRKPLSR